MVYVLLEQYFEHGAQVRWPYLPTQNLVDDQRTKCLRLARHL